MSREKMINDLKALAQQEKPHNVPDLTDAYARMSDQELEEHHAGVFSVLAHAAAISAH